MEADEADLLLEAHNQVKAKPLKHTGLSLLSNCASSPPAGTRAKRAGRRILAWLHDHSIGCLLPTVWAKSSMAATPPRVTRGEAEPQPNEGLYLLPDT